jgi:hypothetical protein
LGSKNSGDAKATSPRSSLGVSDLTDIIGGPKMDGTESAALGLTVGTVSLGVDSETASGVAKANVELVTTSLSVDP